MAKLRVSAPRLSSKKPKEDDSHWTYLGRLSVGIIVLSAILGMFLLYYYLDVQKQVNSPEIPSTTENNTPSAGVVSCEDLGCPTGSQYIGSSQSNVYHECDSGYAMSIMPENRVCFLSAEEAEAQEYRAAAK